MGIVSLDKEYYLTRFKHQKHNSIGFHTSSFHSPYWSFARRLSASSNVNTPNRIEYLRADAVPPTPQEKGAATSDGTGGASGKECFLPVPEDFLEAGMFLERFEGSAEATCTGY